MAHINKVLRSINDDGGHRCVDVFVRPDGSFGFEEYRRDPEDGSGWFAVGGHGVLSFHDVTAALGCANVVVPWLAPLLDAAADG